MYKQIGTYTVRKSDDQVPGEYAIIYRNEGGEVSIIIQGAHSNRQHTAYALVRDFLQNPGNYNLDWTLVKMVIENTYSDGRPLGHLELRDPDEVRYRRNLEKAGVA